MAFTAEQHRAYRVKLKARGICTICHKNESKGKSVCESCRGKHIAHKNELRSSGTFCHDCGRPLDEFIIAIGQRYCGCCRELRQVTRRRYYNKTGR